jgi:hypothetical protein
MLHEPETEREGFEPSIRVSTYAGLANRCLQPLGHLSQSFKLRDLECLLNVGSLAATEKFG